jgi:Mn2+/Fe2+ NRAMP family transporter
VWALVLGTGLFFGLSGVRPIPAIILAQALNGILLPFVSVFLFVLVNDRRLMGNGGLNGTLSNTLMVFVAGTTVILGVTKITQAAAGAFGFSPPAEHHLVAVSAAITLILAIPVATTIRRKRAGF